MISSEDFDHSKYQFNSLSDLGKINPEELSDTEGFITDTLSSTFSKGFSKTFSKGFSKSISKGGYETNPFLTSLSITSPFMTYPLDSLKENLGEEKVVTLLRELRRGNYEEALTILRDSLGRNPELRERRLRELRNYSRQFVFRYQSAQNFDLVYENTPLPEEALSFLSRLGIEGPTSDFTKKDLSHLYRTAPPSQAKSNACVGFTLAADIEFELQKTHQLTSIKSK